METKLLPFVDAIKVYDLLSPYDLCTNFGTDIIPFVNGIVSSLSPESFYSLLTLILVGSPETYESRTIIYHLRNSVDANRLIELCKNGWVQ